MPNPIHPAPARPAPTQPAAFAGLQQVSTTPAFQPIHHAGLPKATRQRPPGTLQIELRDLSPEQQLAVDEPLDCPLLVLAGPGSGKTHFLACRITRALSASPPQVIVAVTYTRKAAAELSQRVRKLAGPAGSKVWISTVHGLALRLLREAGGRRGLPGRAASDQDRRAAARVVLEQPELVQFLQALPDAAMEEGCGWEDAAAGTKKGDPAAKFLRAMEHVGRQKREGVALEEQPLLASAHDSFLQELRRRRLMDVSEVIGLASSLLDGDDDHGSPGLCWAANFVHRLFVDEWQDTDKEQAQFLAKLLAHRTTVTAVGDDDQRIYAWRRGQTSTPAEAFRSHWPQAQLKTLGANKRSLPHLVEASKKLILHNRQREEKDLWPARPATVSDGPAAQVQAFAKETLSTEVRWAAEELRRLRGEGTSWGSFAVLARTNASASFAAQVFSQMSIPTWQSTATTRRTSGAARASVVLDLFAYLRLVVDPHHDVSFLRVYNVPPRGVGKAALRCLREQFGAPARPAGNGASSLDGLSALNLQEVVSRAASLAASTNGGAPGEPASGSLEGAMGRLLKAPWLGANARSAQGLSSLAAVLHAARRAAQNGSGSAADVLRVIMAQTGLGISGPSRGPSGTGLSGADDCLSGEVHGVCAEAPVAAACVVQFLQDSAVGGGLGGCGSSASAASASEGTDCVFVSTIHQAKGLEWHTVFVLQCNEMVLPLQASSEDGGEEERRKAGSSNEPFQDDSGEPGEEEDEEAPLLIQEKLQNQKPSNLSNQAWLSSGCGLGPYIQQLESSFGYELLVMLFVAQHLMKGFVNEFTSPCINFLYGAYRVPGPQMQVYRGVTHLPWAMKPMIGLLSDTMPILGYNKGPYILLVAVLGSAATACIGSVPQSQLTITSLVFCLFLIQLQLSTTDLLTEAKYAEKMQTKPSEGPALMSFVWFGLQCGGLVAMLMVGPIMSHYGPKLPFLVVLVPSSIIVVPVLKNYLQERRLTADDLRAARAVIVQQREACALCLLMMASTLLLTVIGTTLQNVKVNAIASVVVAVVIISAFSLLLRPEIAKVNAFFCLQTAVNFSVGGASFYFYTDTAEQYPEGPHFSKVFYTTVLGVTGSVFSLIGIYTYQKYASDWSFRQLLLVSNVALCVLSVTDVVFFLRLNTRIGIPDHAFILGSSVFATILSQWQWMPGVVILSQLCPPGLEATMYALLAGCHNLGGTIASSTGAFMLELLEVQPSGANKENLWVASAISSVLPALVLLLLPWLIPDRKQTEKLMKDSGATALRQFAEIRTGPARMAMLFYVAMTRARDHLVLSFSLRHDSGQVAEPSRFLYEIGALSSTAERELGPVETAMVPAGPILPPPPPPAPQAQSPTMDGFALQVLATPQVAFSGQDLAEKSMNDIAMHELEPEVDQAEFDTPGTKSHGEIRDPPTPTSPGSLLHERPRRSFVAASLATTWWTLWRSADFSDSSWWDGIPASQTCEEGEKVVPSCLEMFELCLSWTGARCVFRSLSAPAMQTPLTPYRFRLGEERALLQAAPPREADSEDVPSGHNHSYGAVKSRSAWEIRGEPWDLFVEAGVSAGRQLFALVFILVQVLGPHSHENVMNCDPVRCGWYLSIFCEYTKAYVRCFPLLAMAVSLMVATRMVLNHRIYYQLLKHDLLISFDKSNHASEDPLFRLLLWCFANAFPHFIINIWLAHREAFHLVKLGDLASSAQKLMAANVLHDAHQVAVFYFVPAIVFLLFLFSSYDTEALLLPLSKFFEDDFEASRTALKRVRFMRESDVAARVQKGLQLKGGDGATVVDAFQELADAAATDAPAVVARTSRLQRADKQGREEARLRVTWTMWPARLLLDPRLSDKDTVIFRCLWHAFLAVIGLLMLVVFYCLSCQVLKDFGDVWSGQLPDLAGILVELGHFGIAAYLCLMLFRHSLVNEALR
eukprot:s46_g27.t4